MRSLADNFRALVGPNGAGKSTLAYALTGFIPHFYRGHLEGTITVDGKLTAETPLHDLIRSAGLIFQNPFNQISGTKFTVLEEIAFGLENLGVPPDEMRTRVREIMAMLDITDLADRSPVALSGGQMQRVAIASVLAMRPKALILDEPTSQLDPIGSREVFAAVRSLAANAKTTILMIEHKLEWVAQFADRVIALSAGEIIADGKPERDPHRSGGHSERHRSNSLHHGGESCTPTRIRTGRPAWTARHPGPGRGLV